MTQENQRITAYDAKYKKQFVSFGSHNDITALQKLGQLIDSSWHYSWHWPSDIDLDWKKQVQDDLNNRKSAVKQELRDLELAQSILDKIEVY